ncbi:DUF4190 domain-containing protein [Arabiibacter massiliensis]|uniref:DUF4190 domain-containing protein n=1 Tax=Arabiibacter massiliensis TaxID=1870985 RepID=UPI0009BA8A21|nr:DUF4190 domain-containing protein [Arabiibacter massiliensis]
MNDNANARPQPSPEGQPLPPAASDGQQPVAPPAPAYQPQQPYGQQPYPGGPVYAPQPPTAPPAPGSGKALASLICGICAIVFAGTVIVSIALGIVAIVLASQYVKSFGADGKATGGKVCGIVGIALSVLALAGYLMLGALTFAALDEYAHDPVRSYSGSSDTLPPVPGTSDDASSADVAAAKQAVAAELDKVVSPDQATLDAIAREADKEFADDLGFTLTEINVDPVEFATWLAEDMSYTLADDDVRLRADGEGEVRVSAQAKSYKELARGLAGQTGAYVSRDRLDHGMNAAPLDDATKVALAELVLSSLDKVTPAQTTFSVDVMQVGGTWTVERDELDSIIDDVFDL